jgi:dephospho-CoA kinase
MLKVGLTGGIGAGKSVVANVFRLLNTPVYDADAAAKRLMIQDEILQRNIIHHFGKEAYIEGKLNRSYLAARVFSDKEKLELLNSLVHPITIRDASEWFSKQENPYVIKEAALLFESGTAEGLDYVIGVTAPEALRIQRVMHRDQLSREEVKKRMQHQLEDSLKMKLCDYIIHNDEMQLVIPQVLKIHEELLHHQEKTPS